MKRRETLKLFGFLPLIPIFKFPEFNAEGNKTDKPMTEEQEFNLIIFGATPGGIACAVRAAREGLKVLLVSYNNHLGGQFVNGLGTMDTLYNGARAPVYDEFRHKIYNFYRTTYGYQSQQYKDTNPGYPKTRFESHVAERLINEMLENEQGITVRKGYYPSVVDLNGRLVDSILFKNLDSEDSFAVRGPVFADCSYEGDLAAAAGAGYRLGRESRDEFGEINAGVCFFKMDYWPPPDNIIKNEDFILVRQLNLSGYDTWSDRLPESPGEAHEAIMAYNIRTTLTNDPSNRIIPEKPKNYDPEYLKVRYGQLNNTGLRVPNQKTSWNEPRLAGLPNLYVEGDWNERKNIMERFREITLGLLFFKQNDPSVPEAEQNIWREFGLPRNEYTDNGNLPYELYVREARRIIGRSVFTEHDAILADGYKRAPVHNDSISITEWFMDSHFCTERQVEGSKMEGEVMLKNKTFPGQLSFNTIFPKEIDNLMIPVCLSSTHIGWGTIRLEPTWMSIGEAAAFIASEAIREKKFPAEVDTDKLIRLLARNRIMLTFFNDVEGREYSSWYPAIQYFGTQGFFGSYTALPNERLTLPLSEVWLIHASKWFNNKPLDPGLLARGAYKAEKTKGAEFVKAGHFADQLGEITGNPEKVSILIKKLKIYPDSHITRGDACRLLFELTC